MNLYDLEFVIENKKIGYYRLALLEFNHIMQTIFENFGKMRVFIQNFSEKI